MQPWQDPELEAIRQQHVRFAHERWGLGGQPSEKSGQLDAGSWKACAAQGLLGMCMAEEHGGHGRPVTHAVAALEGLGYGCPDGGLVYGLVSQLFGMLMPLQLLASTEIRHRYLPGLLAGEMMMAHAFTEEGCGSDAFAMSTTARATEAGFVLSGAKTHITNAQDAHLALVFAKTGGGRPPFGLTAFVVDLSWEGVAKGRQFEKMGLSGAPMGELLFEEVTVPASHVVGSPGGGLRVLNESTGWERALLLTAVLGPMRRTVEECVQRSRAREQFGQPIGAFQQVSSKIADMVVGLETSRLVIYDMASRLERGNSVLPLMQEAAVTKVFVSESCVRLNLDALQLFGVRGYLAGSPIQQRLSDSLSSTIYAGTSELMRNLIARLAGVPVA